MSFFGLSSAGKDAKGQLSEIPRWQKQQMVDNFGRSDAAYNYAQGMRDNYAAYLQNAVQNGYATPDQIRAYGQQALPGVDPAIARMNGRWDQIASSYGQVPTAGYTSDNIFQNLDNLNGLNADQNNRAGDITSQGYQNAYGRGDTAFNDITGNLGTQGAKNDSVFGDLRKGAAGTYSDLQGGSDRTYNNLIAGSDATYGDLAGGNTSAYGKAQANVQRLLPGGDLAAAKAARAYTPEIVNAYGRLRAAGVDPNSLQGQSVIQAAERDRARGMDDSLSSNLNGYVGAQNDLTLGQENTRRGIATASLANRQGLAQNQLQNGQSLRLGQQSNDQGLSLANLNASNDFASQYRNLIGSNANNKQALDLGLMNQNLQNTDTAYQRSAQNQYDRNNALGQSRNMGLQDWQNQAGILQGQNQQDLTNLGLQQTQYGLGNQYAGNDLNQKNWAASGQGNLAQQQYGLGQGYDQMGGNFANSALQGFGNAYQTEAANAGWGTKMLMGAGLAAASLIPGVGPYISTIGGGAMRGMGGGGYGGYGNQGGYGGYGGGGYGGFQLPKFNMGNGAGGNYSSSDIANGWGNGG